MFGALPLKTRKEIHLLGDRKLFGEAVIDLYSIAKPHLAVMDAVVGMESNGPAHGTPIKTGAIMASYDCVSLDVIASGIMGIDSMQVPTTVAALERGFGNRNPDVVGIDPQTVTQKYKPSSGVILFNLPPFVMRFFGKQFEMKPKINTSKCVLCGACAMNCSVKAIDEIDDYLKINKDKCIMCYCCRELCPANAVDIDMSLVAKIITTVKR
jgi:NAD-dependent dihydropyrimidine dehydrogenase PreA subunit